MTRSISYLVCVFSIVTFSFSAQAKKIDLTKSYGIGLQGATPTFGGISFRYNGLAPVYLQTVGRFILNGQYSDHMLGAGVSYAIFEHQSRWNICPTSFHSRRRLATKKRGGSPPGDCQNHDAGNWARFWRRDCVFTWRDSSGVECGNRSGVW